MTDWSAIDAKLLDSQWYTTGEFHVVFTALRDEDPIHWTQDLKYGKDYWALTRYDDIKECLQTPERFSSRWDTKVPRSPKRMTPEQRHAWAWDVDMARNDNPIHDLYRRPVNKHFSVPAIAKLSADIDAIVDEIIEEIADRGHADLVADVAAPLPMRVILRMLGVPERDWDHLDLAASRISLAADPRYIIDGDEVRTAEIGRKDLLDYCAELALDRRREPQDDFATVIAQTTIDGDLLSIHEMKCYFLTVIVGGLETTRNILGVGTWLMLQNPDQRQKLLDDPGLLKGAVEEILRWTSQPRQRMRVATGDFDFRGKRIRSGDWVVAFLASGNRDERVFDDPHEFDIERTPNEHLSFGSGMHMCLGRNLVRLELASFFPKFFRAFSDLEIVDPDNPSWIADRSSSGFTDMTVTFTPVRASHLA